MATRPFGAVPNIINSIASPINVQFFDQNYAQLLTDFNDSAIGYVNFGADTGTANNYVITLPQAPSAYAGGTTICFTPANSNTAASVINVNAVGSASIVRPDGTALTGGEIVQGVLCRLIYNGSNFVISALPWEPLSSFFSAPITNQTVNCQNASQVGVVLANIGASITLTLNNLAIGINPTIIVSSSGTFTFKIAATLPGGTAYTSITTKLAGAAAGFVQNWITGVSISATVPDVISLQSYLSSGNGILQGVNA